jgi:heme oxygenase
MFCERLREETNEAHERASAHPFITGLIGGDLDAHAFERYLAALVPVYRSLESAMRGSQDASVAVFDHRALDRSARLEADLTMLAGERWTPSTAGMAYAEAIEAAAQSPHRLLAHHYTRYLGDMAGGQAIAALVHRNYGVPKEAMTSLDFSALGDTHHYRKQYRTLLDLMPWSPVEQAEFISSASSGYDLSARMFGALAVEVGLSADAATGKAISIAHTH